MKKELKFKKVQETSHQRFYKLSSSVSKVPNPNFNWDKEKEYAEKRIKDKYKYLIPENIEIVCISDAHTHIERLAFVAAKRREGDYVIVISNQIDGKHTMKIHGGNEKDVHPDEVYLRRISSINNMKFGGVK